MQSIHFTSQDASILYAVPKPPADLCTIVRYHTFVNRCAPPSLDELQGCLDRAFAAGVLSCKRKKIVVEQPWYDRIHAADASADNEIESMLEFEEWLTAQEFAQVSDERFEITPAEYASICGQERSDVT
ncbi:hypothetical protein [Aeoliella sp.]|uniref:hypothetical protein n=1 Tax=Aeoliella sp. TaxID=2795800 RepID=UPI003CCB73D5